MNLRRILGLRAVRIENSFNKIVMLTYGHAYMRCNQVGLDAGYAKNPEWNVTGKNIMPMLGNN